MTIEELVEVEKDAIGSFGNAALLRDKIYLDYLDEICQHLGMSGWLVTQANVVMVYNTSNNDDIRTAIMRYIGRRKAQEILEE